METRALRDEIHPNSHRSTGPGGPPPYGFGGPGPGSSGPGGPGGGPGASGGMPAVSRKPLAQHAIGEQFRGHYLLNRIELKKARNGNSFLSLEIADPSGSISGNKFDAGPDELRALQAVDVVDAWGEVQTFNDRRCARFIEVRPAQGGFDARMFLPRTPHDVRKLYARLLEIIGMIRSPHVRRLLGSFLEDPSFRERFLEAPAAVTNHHAYLGGLVEHIVSLSESCIRTCEAYPSLDRDIMIAGAFLHDIGKVEELVVARGLDYSDKGRMIGHIVTGVLWVEERARRIEGFPPAVLDHLKHVILSHHGELEWGSPIQPCTAEALALHALDNLDAKLWAFDKAVRDARENGSSWSEYVKVFGRKMFKGPQGPGGGGGGVGGAGPFGGGGGHLPGNAPA